MYAGSTTRNDKPNQRFLIAMIVLSFAFVGIIILSYFIIKEASQQDKYDTTRYLFGTILPLLGTWVGTVLAFYFSRENFDAASKSVSDLVDRLPLEERLKSISVKDKMLLYPRFIFYPTERKKDEEIYIVKDLLSLLISKNVNRLPIIDETTRIKYLLHRSIIDRYLSEISINSDTKQNDADKKTLKNLLEHDQEVRKFAEKSFGFVQLDASLSDAKLKMNQIENCDDIIVTSTGDQSEPVIGWITSNMIEAYSKV